MILEMREFEATLRIPLIVDVSQYTTSIFETIIRVNNW